MHPPRYESYPKQIMIGYAEKLTGDDAQIFIDITQKHRSNIAMVIDQGNDAELVATLESITLARVGGTL